MGQSLIFNLYFFSREIVNKPHQKDIITQEELKFYFDSQYMVTTVVPLVENPVRNIRNLNQEEFDDFLEGYNEHAEFLVEIKRI